MKAKACVSVGTSGIVGKVSTMRKTRKRHCGQYTPRKQHLIIRAFLCQLRMPSTVKQPEHHLLNVHCDSWKNSEGTIIEGDGETDKSRQGVREIMNKKWREANRKEKKQTETEILKLPLS